MEEKKTINIKNKKEVKKKLSSSVKGTKKIKKPVAKKVVKKAAKKPVKKPVPKKIVVEEEKVLEKEIVSKAKKAPKKIKKDDKSTLKKAPAKKVPSKKKEVKPRAELVLPKEWQKIAKEKEKENDLSKTFKYRLQERMFEELPLEEIERKKVEAKKKYTKRGIYLLFAVSIFLIFVIVFDLTRDKDKKSQTNFIEYKIGERIKLKDGSFWFVVANSMSDEEEVILLKENIIDVNNDNKFDEKDKVVFNANKVVKYDITSKGSVAEYLELIYKKKLTNLIGGSVVNIRLLTSKEFVKMRDALGFPYDWKTENILAGKSLGNWWIEGFNKDRVFTVSTMGAYKLNQPGDYNYIRPVIVINKNLI